MNQSDRCRTQANSKRDTWRQHRSSPCQLIFSVRGLVQGVSTVLLSWAGFEFLCSLPFFLYLCRAARGSADIPILPHAHTILLKHAVNLKRRRTLFNERTVLSSHPFVSAQIALSHNYWTPPPHPKLRWCLCPAICPARRHVTLWMGPYVELLPCVQ